MNHENDNLIHGEPIELPPGHPPLGHAEPGEPGVLGYAVEPRPPAARSDGEQVQLWGCSGEVHWRCDCTQKELLERRTDSKRLDWIIEGLFGENTDAFMVRLAGALMLGKTGRDAIDAAMEAK